MAIEFDCPSCGGTLQVGDESAGRIIRCGGCMTALRVPTAGAATAAEPPADPNPYGGQSYPPPPPPPPAKRATASTAEANPDEPPAAAKPVAPRRRDRDRDNYDDDRRERRSRRRPPPPAGKGVFFWLVIIGAVMLVGVAVCCGGLLLFMPDVKWQSHESKVGGFKVELPAKPRPDIVEAAGLRLEKGTNAEGTVLLRKGAEKFVVIYRDIESTKRRGGDEKELDERVKKLQRGMEADKLESDVAFTQDGFPAREIEFYAKTGWHKARVIVADTRVYIVLAGGGVAEPGDPNVKQFLESFKITDPKLLTEGKRREEQAKLAADEAKAAKERAAKRRAEEEEEQNRRAEERKATEAAREAKELHEAAEIVAEAALAVARRTRPVPPPAPLEPPLPVAPAPRPVGE